MGHAVQRQHQRRCRAMQRHPIITICHPYSLQKVEWGQIGIIEAEAVDIKVDASLTQRLQQVSAHGVIGEIETGKIGAVGQGAFHFGAIMFEF